MSGGTNIDFDESSLSPTVTSAQRNTGKEPSSDGPNNDVQAARLGLLKAIWKTTLAPRFSSRPIDLQTSNALNSSEGTAFTSKPINMEGYFSSTQLGVGSFERQNSCVTVGTAGTNNSGSLVGTKGPGDFRNSLRESAYLTPSERGYLEELLQSEDLESIRRASVRLSDKEVFPAATDSDDDEEVESAKDGPNDGSTAPLEKSKRKSMLLPPSSAPQCRRRDSQVQEQLFKLHEKTTIMPSVVLKRMSSSQSAKKAASYQSIPHINSLTQDDEITDYESHESREKSGATENELEEVHKTEKRISERQEKHPGEDNALQEQQNWDSDLLDLNAWIARTEGVEVDEEGHASETANVTSNPFKILGISANDVSCQPMVLSPPLMEGLQSFMPESLQEHHYWLKYSLVRDGPGLMKMLRHCRGSQHTILAIESTDGHVFGSFTSQPWRLMSLQKGTSQYYGSKESFVWRMRQSRFEPCESVVEQILMESKIDVFPYTSRNNHVQSCTKSGIAMGYGEIKDENDPCDDDQGCNPSSTDSNQSSHYGHAIQLEKSLAMGSTSSSETFGNPCLIERESRGKEFQISNVELWTMTPHETVEDADQAEMRALFLQQNRQADGNLNLIEILVGGTHKSH